MRIVRVQEKKFHWLNNRDEFPADKEIHVRKEDFLSQLEIQQATSIRRVCVLYLLHDYPDSWEDVIGPLFVMETPGQGWQSAILVM